MKSLRSFLIDLANNELKGNLLAWIIANYYDNINRTSKESLFESLSVYYSKHKGETELKAIPAVEDVLATKEGAKDFRLCALTLSNIRGIPGKIDNIPFGIDFTENNEIKNVIILGPNGSGKSSIFAALEYVYANRIGEAELRTYDNFDDGDKYFLNYLKHFNNNPECSVLTPSGQYSIDKTMFPVKEIRSKINPNNFFIGDYDIYDNGRKNYIGLSDDETSFHYLIAKSLGLQDYIDFQFLIDDLSRYRRLKESNELSRLIGEKNERENEIKNCITEITKREEEIKILLELNSSSESNELKKQFESDNQLYQKIKQNNISYNFNLNELFGPINHYLQSYKELNLAPLRAQNETETEFLSLGLELLKNFEITDCPFCNDSRKDISTIKNEVKSKISAYDNLKTIKTKTSELYTLAIDSLIQLYSFLHPMIKSLNSELSEMSTNPLFFNLYNKQKELCTRLELSVSDSFQEIQKVITSRVSFSQSNFDILFNILLGPVSKDKFQDAFNNISSLAELRKQEISNIENELKNRQGFSTTLERIAVLNSEKQKFSDQIKLAEIRVTTVEKEIPKYQKMVDLRNEIKENANSVKNVISNKISEVVNSVFEPVESIIKTILNDYFEDKNVSIEIYRDPSNHENEDNASQVLKARIVYNEQNGITYLTPNEYFNTFRYRLFCLMVSCSVAIATRRVTGMNLPFVLDDIFYASDYLNRSTIMNFLQKLLKLIKKYSPQELELQIVLFTHDELIFNSAYDTIITSSDLDLEEKTIFARLFPPEDKGEIVEFEKNYKFWNLLYPISTKLSAEISDSLIHNTHPL